VEVDRMLEEVVERLRREFNVKAVILFGSRARGDWTPWSDFDLLIIADFREKYLDRVGRVLEVVGDTPLDIEPHPYTLEEAAEMLRKCNPLMVDALEEGRVLHATGEYRMLLDIYEELRKKGLRRTETTIVMPSDSAQKDVPNGGN